MVRLATPEEASAIYENPTCPVLVYVHLDQAEVTGHLCLAVSQGAVFGFNTKVWSESKTAAAQLWLRARRDLRAMGVKEVYINFDDSTSDDLYMFWKRVGFRHIATTFKGEI